MKILHVIPSLAERDGGPSKAVIEMCGELGRRGHDPQIYTTNVDGDGRLDVMLERAVQVHGIATTYFPVIPGGGYYRVSARMAVRLRKTVGEFDLVHVHSLYQCPSMAAAYYCRRYGVPYIIQPHGSLAPYIRKQRWLRKRVYEVLVEQRILAGAGAALFTTSEEMRLAKLSSLRFRSVVVPLGLEIEETLGCTKGAAEAIWPQLAGKKVVLFLGRIHAVKALDVLTRAFGAIHRTHPNAHLLIAGPDTDGYAEQVRRWLAEEGALEGVTFTGMVFGKQKAALLRRANLFVLPSYTENFGIAAVEGMAAGLPIVVSNRVSIWREIDGAQAGLVVNPDAGELAHAMLKLLDNPTAATEMGERGRRLARERFSWRAAGERLVELYESIGNLRAPAVAVSESA